jgi:hypothetical protein
MATPFRQHEGVFVPADIADVRKSEARSREISLGWGLGD